MDNLNKDEMMEAIESSFTRIHRGDIIKGTILYVTENELMVNINYKSDGIVAKDEVSYNDDINLKETYKVGDELDVYIMKLDDGEGNVVLSAKRVDDLKNWDVLEEAFNNKEIIECKVINAVKGGLTVLVKGINGFIPASHVSTSFVSKLDEFKGKKLKVKVIDFDKTKRRVILSRKEVEKKELEAKKAELWNTLKVDDIITGVVQRLTDFGAFVDLGGVDGLIHISDLSWLRVKHPSDVLKVGKKVEVKILALDKEKNRISLGLKQTIEEPWEIFKRNVNQGDIVEGKVVNLLDFGAFVRLNEGVDGLLHVSQISKEHVNKPSDVLKIGDTVTVKVIEINDEERRISLSAKDVNPTEDVIVENNEEIKNEELDTTVGDIINSNK
jgi:4-hydroxy-3-methylbut-2-enyl diphosphate reductase